MKKSTKRFIESGVFFVLFAVFTLLVKKVDVQAIGPEGSKIGFASINAKFFEMFGYNEFWYKFSERLGYAALAVCAIFALIGVLQFIKGKGLKAVDKKIIALGVFYVVVIAFYVAFNKIIINYRPILEADGSLEASYPSSHTVLAICVFVTMFSQKVFNRKKTTSEKAENVIAGTILVALMILSRLFSGVHWFTDIVGGVILSTALVLLYKAAASKIDGE